MTWHEQGHQHPQPLTAALSSQAYCLCPSVRHRHGGGAWYGGVFFPLVLFGTSFVQTVYSMKKQHWLATKADEIQKALNKMARKKNLLAQYFACKIL